MFLTWTLCKNETRLFPIYDDVGAGPCVCSGAPVLTWPPAPAAPHCTAPLLNDLKNTSGAGDFWVQSPVFSLMRCLTFASY